MLNQIIIKTMPLLPKAVVHIFAKKYIAGDNLSDAVRVTKELEKIGGWSTIDVLGEFVTTKERAMHERGMSEQVLMAIKENNMQTYLSVKPTSLGLGIDFDFGYENIKYLIEKADSMGIWARLDMENSPYTTKTLDAYKKLRSEGFAKVGFVLQAYMRRSEEDLNELLKYKPSIRLCKGIYNEAPEIAFKKPDEIRDNYKKLLRIILDNGIYVGIATHDDILLNFAKNQVSERKLANDKYEFQMLLGVREEKRNEILRLGHHLRVYVPFGKDWYGYSIRRLKENPQMAGHIVKSIFIKN